MAEPKWQLSGEYMESCNCDYLCPCIYTNSEGAVTRDNCTAVLVFRIDRGRSGNIGVDGLCFALLIRSGKVMADGDWSFACVVDERADDDQRSALSAIVSGEAGGTPGMIRSALVSDFRGVAFKPIDVRIDGLNRSVSIPDIVSFDVEGVRSPLAEDEALYIGNSGHPANPRVALARARRLSVQGFGLDLDMIDQGNNGHFASFTWAA